MMFSPVSVFAAIAALLSLFLPSIPRDIMLALAFGWFSYRVALTKNVEDALFSVLYLVVAFAIGSCGTYEAIKHQILCDWVQSIPYYGVVFLMIVESLAAQFGIEAKIKVVAIITCLYAALAPLFINVGFLTSDFSIFEGEVLAVRMLICLIWWRIDRLPPNDGTKPPKKKVNKEANWTWLEGLSPF